MLCVVDLASSREKIVSEYDQEIPQSETADNPCHREEEPLHHHETPGRQSKQSNQLSLPGLVSLKESNPLPLVENSFQMETTEISCAFL